MSEDFTITGGSSMAAIIFKLPPQFGQCSMSMLKTRLSKRAQLRRADAPCACASSLAGSVACSTGVGMISGRRAPRSRSRAGRGPRRPCASPALHQEAGQHRGHRYAQVPGEAVEAKVKPGRVEFCTIIGMPTG